MSKVCGIELKGNEAIVVVLEGTIDNYQIASISTSKIKLIDSINQGDIINFKNEILTFVESNNIERIGIKARATKGRFSGGSVSFKMEGIIQLAPITVSVIHGKTIIAKIKNDDIDFGGLKKYQFEAMNVAHYLLSL